MMYKLPIQVSGKTVREALLWEEAFFLTVGEDLSGWYWEGYWSQLPNCPDDLRLATLAERMCSIQNGEEPFAYICQFTGYAQSLCGSVGTITDVSDGCYSRIQRRGRKLRSSLAGSGV
jgi:hypothetical protein